MSVESEVNRADRIVSKRTDKIEVTTVVLGLVERLDRGRRVRAHRNVRDIDFLPTNSRDNRCTANAIIADIVLREHHNGLHHTIRGGM